MKKILILIIGIGLIFGLVGIGTQAYFSDVETSGVSIFTSGVWDNPGVESVITTPVITLLGKDPVNLYVDETYKDAGATAIDNAGDDITSDITTTGLPINTTTASSHIITYNVSDKSGNSAIQVTRTVNVIAASVTLSSIAITTSATKLSYTAGDPLDINGLVVTGTYSDGSSAPVTISTSDVSGFNSSALVTGQVLTITVDGKTATYTVDVVGSQN